jgi:drug/metabolite transporter (DMT)-like permease
MDSRSAQPQRITAAYSGLFIGVAGVSVAAILIRLADSDPLTVAAYRMGIATLAVSAVALARSPRLLSTVTRGDVPWLLAGGAFLALHFAAFITALDLTSVANSVFLVTTAPMFVAIGSHWGLHDRVSPVMAGAIALSLSGGVVLAVGDLSGGESRVAGDLLAVLGALAAAGYMLVGRRLRGHIPLLPYITLVYATSAVLLLGGAIAAGSPMTGLPGSAYFWMAMVALISQGIGHSALNWSLAHMSATLVALSVRVEPVVATLLAVPVLGETPSWTVAPGGALVLLGAYMAVRAETGATLRPRTERG